MRNFTLLNLLIPIFLFQQSICQNAPVTYVPELAINPGTMVDIPVTVKSFNNIGAISLTLRFDGSVLTYQSYFNDSGFPSLIVGQPMPGEIIISAFIFPGNPGITLPDDAILFTLTFFCNGGATELKWFDDGGSCEYADEFYYPLYDYPTCTYYSNGSVNFSTINLGLKVFLEGPFFNGEMNTTLRDMGLVPTTHPYSASPWNYGCPESVTSVPPNVIDWVLVELRLSAGGPALANENTKVAEQVGFLMKDGFIRELDGVHNLDFSVPITNNLYIVIYHRNHINILSSTPVSIANGSGAYDFTADSLSVWGGMSAYKQLSPGIYCMIAGDCNGDGSINILDKNDNMNSSIGNMGYFLADFSFDSQVNNQDKNKYWFENLGFTSVVP